jgi:hypothetical protein
MKKLVVVATLLALLLSSITTASASCTLQPTMVAVSDGGGTSRSNNTNNTNQNASNGGVNQNATVQGNGNAVNIRQTVNRAGDSYSNHYSTTNVTNVTVVQVVEPAPEPQHPNYDKLKAIIAVYGEAFIARLNSHMEKYGWGMILSVETVQTHNYVCTVKFTHESGFISETYKILYYTQDHESYCVALTTAYHSGWRVKDYPGSQVIFLAASEDVAISNIMLWLKISFESSLSIANHGYACGCCPNCSCHGTCHEGCGCGCSD